MLMTSTMTTQQRQYSAAVAVILLTTICRTSDAMSTSRDRQLTKVTSRMTPETTDVIVNGSSPKSLHSSDVTLTSKSLLTSFLTPTTISTSSAMSTGLRDKPTTSAYTAALTSTQRKSILSVASTTALKLGRDITSSSATDTTTNIQLFSAVVKQTSSVPPVLITTSPADEYPISPNRTTSLSAMQTSEVMNNRSSSVTTSPLKVTALTTTSSVVTSFPLYTGNATQALGFSDKQLASVTSRIGTVVNGSIADYTSMTPLEVTATTSYTKVDKTKALAIGIGVGLAVLVVLLCIVIIVVTVLANRRRQRRKSDKLKLAPSVRNYDRVIPPANVASSSSSSSNPQQQSKIRHGRRGNRLPSSQEVFDLGIHPPQASDIDMSPSPEVSPATSPVDVLNPSASAFASSTPRTDPAGRGTGKNSSRKDDKPSPARRLRGRPPELQNSYFVPDDDGGAGASSASRKSAKKDPFWEVPEAHSTPRRPSIEQRSPSLFKPPSSSENSASTSKAVADVGTSIV